MSRRTRHPNHHSSDENPSDAWDLAEGLDPDGPSAEDLDRFGSELDTCPSCGSSIYDQAEMCPQCGEYLGETPKTLSLWVIFAVCVLMGLLIWMMM